MYVGIYKFHSSIWYKIFRAIYKCIGLKICKHIMKVIQFNKQKLYRRTEKNERNI